jgi:dsDNA-specific endonuclease/ATPase MutS2
MQILIGDNQSVDRGLSSFGGEMEALKEILDNGTERSIVLIDEIASGTNPAEGFALTKSIVNYLSDKPYISLVTTHFDNVSSGENVKDMQVAGLSGVDFTKLEREIRYANRRERINIIAKYMDYRLCNVTRGKEVPKDALNIAKMLGLNKNIIENAKKYLEGGKNEE